MAGQISEPAISVSRFWFFFSRVNAIRAASAPRSARGVPARGPSPRTVRRYARSTSRHARLAAAAGRDSRRRRRSAAAAARETESNAETGGITTERLVAGFLVCSPSRDARGRSPGRGRCGRRREYTNVRALRRRHNRAGSEELSRGPRRVRLGDAVRVASPPGRFPGTRPSRTRHELQSWLSRGDRRPQRLRLPRPRLPLPRVRHIRAHPPAVCRRRGHRADARDRLRRAEGLMTTRDDVNVPIVCQQRRAAENAVYTNRFRRSKIVQACVPLRAAPGSRASARGPRGRVGAHQRPVGRLEIPSSWRASVRR